MPVGFSAQLLLDIRDSVQAYLNTLVTRGALLGGRVWLDPERADQAGNLRNIPTILAEIRAATEDMGNVERGAHM